MMDDPTSMPSGEGWTWRPLLEERVSVARPAGLDDVSRGRFEGLNRRIAGAALIVLGVAAVVLAYAEFRSAWLASRGWDMIYENPEYPVDAVGPLSAAVRLKRTNLTAIEGLWQAESILGRYDEAVNLARMRLRFDVSPTAYVTMARSLLRAAERPPGAGAEERRDAYVAAVGYLAQAVAVDHYDCTALEILLDCYVQLGEAELAAAVRVELMLRYARLRKEWLGIKNDPSRPRRQRALAFNNLAWLAATSRAPVFRNDTEAMLDALKAVELAKDHDERYVFLDTLAEAYHVNGHPMQAVFAIDEAIALRPDDIYYYVSQKRRFMRRTAGVET